MNFTQAKNCFFNELMESQICSTKAEVIARLGKTTIRVLWVDYCDFLSRDKQITEKQRMSWGQVI